MAITAPPKRLLKKGSVRSEGIFKCLQLVQRGDVLVISIWTSVCGEEHSICAIPPVPCHPLILSAIATTLNKSEVTRDIVSVGQSTIKMKGKFMDDTLLQLIWMLINKVGWIFSWNLGGYEHCQMDHFIHYFWLMRLDTVNIRAEKSPYPLCKIINSEWACVQLTLAVAKRSQGRGEYVHIQQINDCRD